MSQWGVVSVPSHAKADWDVVFLFGDGMGG
jgi:hypothetical protein